MQIFHCLLCCRFEKHDKWLKKLSFKKEEGKGLCHKRDMENTEEPKEDFGKDSNLILGLVSNNSSLDSEYGHKERLNVNLPIGQKKEEKSYYDTKRSEHFIQVEFGDSSAFEIRQTPTDNTTTSNQQAKDSEKDGKKQTPVSRVNVIDNSQSKVHGINFKSEKDQECQDEAESTSATGLQKNINNCREPAIETGSKKRTINMIVSDILKSKETVDKEKSDDVHSKDGSGSEDTRRETQPKKRRKARNPVNLTYSEDSQCIAEDSLFDKDDNFNCEVCFASFSRNIDLAEHYMLHKDEEGYTYMFNGNTFETTPDQQSFIESYFYSKMKEKASIHENGPEEFYQNIPVNQDNDDYSNQSAMEEGSEMVKSESENPLQCDYCDKAFSSTLLLKRHISVHTGERPHKCDVCGKTFNLPHHLKTHARIHTNVRPYKCDVCGRAFNESSSLKRHTRIHAKERPYIYICDVCGKTFNEPHNLRTHLRIHSDVKPYTCGVCKKAFIRQQTLKNHMRIHTDERPYKCEVCEKAFKELHHLKIHVRIHTDIRPYKCDICEKTFNERSSLKRHIRIHTGEKPYKCSLCDKAFNHNESLKIHLRHHTGERPFRCDICDKTFTDPKNYKSHQKTHSSELKFKCESCDKSFSEEARMWQHMRIHTGDLPFKCMICGKTFNQSSSLKRHLKTLHPGINLSDKSLFPSIPVESDEDEDLDEEDDMTDIADVVNEPPETSTTFPVGV